MVENFNPDAALFPERVGDRLRNARTKAGLDLADVATKTRVPLRHLQAIEGGDYSSLPSTTYAVGFVKAYARAVGADENTLAHDLRAELGEVRAEVGAEATGYTDIDPARMPTRLLAWTALAAALIIFGGFAWWRTQMVSDPAAEEIAAPAETPAAPAAGAKPSAPAASPTGQVTLTASAPVWLRIYDANDKVLFEKEMAAGERYDVPADANDPKIRTGRAELIAVTVGGQAVAPLGPAERTVKDVRISAAALTARPPAATPIAPPAPTTGNAAAPMPIPANAVTTGNTVVLP